MVSSTPGLYSLDAGARPPPPAIVTPERVSRPHSMFSWVQNYFRLRTSAAVGQLLIVVVELKVHQFDENMFNIMQTKMQTEAARRYHPTPMKIAKTFVNGNAKCWQVCKETGNLIYCWWDCK